MNPTETVEEYYETLRRGEPLSPYFVEREDVVKFGISERLTGYNAVAEGLREQTRTTEDWQVESKQLQVVTPKSETGKTVTSVSIAWFTDDVVLSWTDSTGERQSFDTRWSGVLERDDRDGRDSQDDRNKSDGQGNRDDETAGANWRFAQMHVSAPHDL
jgi:hypothetical protein